MLATRVVVIVMTIVMGKDLKTWRLVSFTNEGQLKASKMLTTAAPMDQTLRLTPIVQF